MERDEKQEAKVSRRSFLGQSSLGALGAGLSLAGAGGAAGPAAAQEEPKAVPQVELGDTGRKVGVIAFGSYGLGEAPDVLARAVEAGINFVDTGPDYSGGNVERTIGQALKQVERDAVVLETKWHVNAGSTKEDLLGQLDACLERLDTPKVDFINAYSPAKVEDFSNPAMLEAFDEAQAAGKADFLGTSAHGGDVGGVLRAALDCGRVSLFLLKYNFMDFRPLEALAQEAHDKGIGLVAMKCKAGNQQEELPVEGDVDGKLAATKWALHTGYVHSVCAQITSLEDVDYLVRNVTKVFTPEEQAYLDRYREHFAGRYCRHCGTCAEACPRSVAVADIMRYRMYFRYYKLEKDSMRRYAELRPEQTAAACVGCPGHCVGACPHGIPTQERLVSAHKMLRMA